jgi:hypothetical protein
MTAKAEQGGARQREMSIARVCVCVCVSHQIQRMHVREEKVRRVVRSTVARELLSPCHANMCGHALSVLYASTWRTCFFGMWPMGVPSVDFHL